MTINHSKSGIFVLNAKRSGPHMFPLKEILGFPIVFEYKYLGVTFSNYLCFNLHLDSIKKKLTQLTKRMKRIHSNKVPLTVKIQIFNNYISSRIFYGLEIAVTWSSQLNKMITLYTSNLKNVIGLKQNYPNNLLLKLTSIKNPISILVNRFKTATQNLKNKVKDDIPALKSQI